MPTAMQKLMKISASLFLGTIHRDIYGNSWADVDLVGSNQMFETMLITITLHMSIRLLKEKKIGHANFCKNKNPSAVC
ncbi:MAG: hypothetical protein BAA00_13975 [Parageobacillus thermoglucosidasius]|nr:hypothetical protein [Parageobacillus thermoglucosidasius]OUM85428.1 MAG: hypothetical protein BAA00_13975 [Parageobacillus thermoglucosidasius]